MLRRRCIMISAFFIYTAAVFCAAIFLSSTGLFEYKKDVLSDSRAVADDFEHTYKPAGGGREISGKVTPQDNILGSLFLVGVSYAF